MMIFSSKKSKTLYSGYLLIADIFFQELHVSAKERFLTVLVLVKRHVKWLQTRNKKFKKKTSKSLEAVVNICSTDKMFRKFLNIPRKTSLQELRPATETHLELSRTSIRLFATLINIDSMTLFFFLGDSIKSMNSYFSKLQKSLMKCKI